MIYEFKTHDILKDISLNISPNFLTEKGKALFGMLNVNTKCYIFLCVCGLIGYIFMIHFCHFYAKFVG